MIELDWIHIPAGYFTYGVTDDQVPERFHEPARQVFLDAFYISRYPVTWLQFYEWAKSDHQWAIKNIYSAEGAKLRLAKFKEISERKPNHPATVAWHLALGFCEWVSARLPTSMEWEKAARGADGQLYPWGNEWDITKGNFFSKIGVNTNAHASTPVTKFPQGASPYGVVDMMGNALEYTISTAVGNDNGNDAEKIICRGSSCNYSAQEGDNLALIHRVTHVSLQPKNYGAHEQVGLRPVRSLWQKQALERFP